MSMKINVSGKLERGSLIGCASLALLATMISLLLSVLTGWQLGHLINEKLAMAAFGVLAVLGAHLLLALCRPASTWVRFIASLLWLLCMAYVAYSHASFFLSSQQQAGVHRVAVIDQSLLRSEPKRTLTAILSDQVSIKTQLAAKSRTDCKYGCFKLKVAVTSLEARLDVLNAEADEVKRWHMQHDRHEALKDALRDDPVTTRLAKWLSVTETKIGLVMGLLFSLILEGVACLCWYVVLQSRYSSVTKPVTQLVTPVPVVSALATRSLSELDIKVEELIREVKAGRLRLTVNGVRNYCQCAQKKAAELKRMIDVKLNADSQIC